MPIQLTLDRSVDLSTIEQCEHARTIAAELSTTQDSVVDVVHVLLACVRKPWTADCIADCPTWSSLLHETGKRNALEASLLSLALEPRESAAPSSGGQGLQNETAETAISLALDRCFTQARLSWRDLNVPDFALIWAILEDKHDDNPSHRAFRIMEIQYGINSSVLVEELANKLRNMPRKYIAEYLPQPITPTTGLEYAMRHQALIDTLSTELRDCEPNQILIVIGPNGSPMHYIGQLFADRLDQQDSALTKALPNIRCVVTADIDDYLLRARGQGTPNADTLLQAGIQHAGDLGAMLVLEHLEKLALPLGGDARLQSLLLTQLTTPRGTLIIGLYDEPEELDVASTLNISSRAFKLYQFRPYFPEQTLTTLLRYFVPLWEQQGFTFEGITRSSKGTIPNPQALKPAFIDLLALEPGGWGKNKPMRAPYLLVTVVDSLLKRLSVGDAASVAKFTDDIVGIALHRVATLTTTEAQDADSEVAAFYGPVLERVKRELNQTRRQLECKRDSQNRQIITRGHLVAELLGSNTFAGNFKYPKRLPPWHAELVEPPVPPTRNGRELDPPK